MTSPNVPGRPIEIFFARADRTVVLETGEDDPDVADAIVAALASEDPDETEGRLRSTLGIESVISGRR